MGTMIGRSDGMQRRWFRLWPVLLVFGVLLALVAVAPQAVGASGLQVQFSNANGQKALTLVGNGFGPGEKVTISGFTTDNQVGEFPGHYGGRDRRIHDPGVLSAVGLPRQGERATDGDHRARGCWGGRGNAAGLPPTVPAPRAMLLFRHRVLLQLLPGREFLWARLWVWPRYRYQSSARSGRCTGPRARPGACP